MNLRLADLTTYLPKPEPDAAAGRPTGSVGAGAIHGIVALMAAAMSPAVAISLPAVSSLTPQ